MRLTLFLDAEVRLVLGSEFLVSFCIFMIFDHFLTYDKNSGAHDMDIRLVSEL